MPSRSTKTPLRFGLLATALFCMVGIPAALADQFPPDVTLSVNASDLEVISRALQAQPNRKAAGTIAKIRA